MNPPEVAPEPDLARRLEYARRSRARLALLLAAITPREWGRIGVLAMAGLVIGWLVVATFDALLPFALGGIVAYALLPVVNVLNRVLPRWLAAALGLALGFAVLGGLVLVIVPALAREVLLLSRFIPGPGETQQLLDQVNALIGDLPDNVEAAVRSALVAAFAGARAELDELFASSATAAFQAVVASVNALALLIGLLALPAWMFALLVSQRHGRAAVNRTVPAWALPDTWAVIGIVDRTMNQFLRAQLLIALTVAGLTWLMLVVLDVTGILALEAKAPIAALAGVMQLIPTLGPFLGALPVLFFVVLSLGPEAGLVLAGGYLAVHVTEHALFARRLTNRLVPINPVFLLLALVALGQLGFVWLLFAAPVTAIARDLFRYALGRFSEPPQPAGVLPRNAPPPRRARRRGPAVAAPAPARRLVYQVAAPGPEPTTRPTP